jgi:hypothetical protein
MSPVRSVTHVVGSLIQSLTILQILQIEPLVRLLRVPELKYRFQ